jgi:DNA-binding MarR family transcriptional regulator
LAIDSTLAGFAEVSDGTMAKAMLIKEKGTEEHKHKLRTDKTVRIDAVYKVIKEKEREVKQNTGDTVNPPQPEKPKDAKGDFYKIVSDFALANKEYETAEILRRILLYEGAEHSPEVRSHLIADFEVLRKSVIGEDSDEVFVETVREYVDQNNCDLAPLVHSILDNVVDDNKEVTISILDKSLLNLREYIITRIYESGKQESKDLNGATTQLSHAEESILLTLSENILNYYKIEEIAINVGLDSENVMKYLKQLEAKNLVDEINYEDWRITENGIRHSGAMNFENESYCEDDESNVIRILYHNENMTTSKIAKAVGKAEPAVLKILQILQHRGDIIETDNCWALIDDIHDMIPRFTRKFYKNTDLIINMFQNPMTVGEIAELFIKSKNKNASKYEISKAIKESDEFMVWLLQILEDEGNVARVGEKWRLTDKAVKDEGIEDDSSVKSVLLEKGLFYKSEDGKFTWDSLDKKQWAKEDTSSIQSMKHTLPEQSESKSTSGELEIRKSKYVKYDIPILEYTTDKNVILAEIVENINLERHNQKWLKTIKENCIWLVNNEFLLVSGEIGNQSYTASVGAVERYLAERQKLNDVAKEKRRSCTVSLLLHERWHKSPDEIDNT